jgi:transposase-like protein
MMEATATYKRKTYCDAEKSSLLEAYKQSDKSKKQWCKENGIGLSTLHKWLQNDKNLTKPQDVQAWVPVITITPETDDGLLIQIGKFSIPVAKHTDVQLLSTVLKVMIDLC